MGLGLQLCRLSSPGELNTKLNVWLETLDCGFEELLLVFIDFRDEVDSFDDSASLFGCQHICNIVCVLINHKCSYPKLDRDGKKVNATKRLADIFTTWDTRQVNKGRFGNTLLTLGCVHPC